MGKILVDKLLSSLEKMPVPETAETTGVGRQTYEIGLEKVDEYRGEPKTLIRALRIFQTCNSRPYTLAGVAFTLLMAAKEKDGSFAQNGLEAAMAWLEEAQALEPDIVLINMIEPFIYTYSKRFDDARLVLDYLKKLEPDNIYLLQAEIAYWQQQEKYEEAIQWYQTALQQPRQFRSLHHNIPHL